jgi:hypothetical protein
MVKRYRVEATGRSKSAGGALAGIVAGLVMAVVMMIYFSVMGAGFWYPVENIAAVFFGIDALLGGAGVVIVGLLTHLLVSALLGMLFASLLQPRTSTGAAFFGGLAYGIGVWVVMTYIILPIFNPTMSARMAVTAGFWFFSHLIYGGFLAFTPGLVREFALRGTQREQREERPPRRKAA